jgi:hypothetical protein
MRNKRSAAFQGRARAVEDRVVCPARLTQCEADARLISIKSRGIGDTDA